MYHRIDMYNIIFMWAFCLHNAHSIVMTQYPTDIIIKYLLHVSKSSERLKEEALDIFHAINISAFCSATRITYVYRAGPQSAAASGPEPEFSDFMVIISPPEHNEIADVEQPGVQLRKFKIANLNQTLSLHSFQCSNNEEKPIWFVATAFVPHSAFLFEVEPKFRHLIARETKGNNGIPAKLLGLIDKEFINRQWSQEDTSLYRYLRSTNFTGKDKICDLHSILQFRLCALGVPRWFHRDRSFNIYDPSLGGCRPLTVKEAVEFDISNSLETQEMLHCPLRIYGSGLVSIYVGLVGENPLELVSIQMFWHDEFLIRDHFYMCYKIFPILRYLDSYQSLLKNFDVSL